MSIVSAVSGLVGAPLLGWLSEALGPRTTLVAAGTAGMLACAVAARLLPLVTRAPRRIEAWGAA